MVVKQRNTMQHIAASPIGYELKHAADFVRIRELRTSSITSAMGHKQACPGPAFEVRFTFNSGTSDPQLPDYLSVGALIFLAELTIAPGRTYAGAAGEFAASALFSAPFRGMTGAVTRPRAWLITTRRAFESRSRNQSG